jgi:hypothetical protein
MPCYAARAMFDARHLGAREKCRQSLPLIGLAMTFSIVRYEDEEFIQQSKGNLIELGDRVGELMEELNCRTEHLVIIQSSITNMYLCSFHHDKYNTDHKG